MTTRSETITPMPSSALRGAAQIAAGRLQTLQKVAGTKKASPSVTHDRVFIAGKYVPVKARTVPMLLEAAREGTLRIHDQPTSTGKDRRRWGAGRRYLGVNPKDHKPTPREAETLDLERQRWFDDKSFAERRTLSPAGWVYVMTNRAFPGWVKIGRSTDPERRLFNYQTADPFRGYALEYWGWFSNAGAGEGIVHERVAWYASARRGEWFLVDLETAADAVAGIQEQF